MTDTPQNHELTLGDTVIDREDDEPNEAIVIWRPADQTITDWTYDKDGETRTTADDNPAYPEDEQLVVVAFRRSLDATWPDWEDAAPADLFDGTADRDIAQYGFPESRLQPIEPGELAAQWLDGLADRLDAAGWDVTHEPTALVVEQYGETYRIRANGTVDGTGDYRAPLETLLENYRQ